MSTRVYVGGLSYRCREEDIERFFRKCGRIREISIKKGYAFVEFDDYRDADDACYELHGKELMGERITIELAKGTPHGRDKERWGGGYGGGGRRRSRSRDRGGAGGRDRDGRRPIWLEKYGPPTRTDYRVIVENLSSTVSWQDLKDFMRQAGDVTYADAHKSRRNEGVVEFSNYEDMKHALSKLDDMELNGRRIKLIDDSRGAGGKRSGTRSRSKTRSRSRSRRDRSRSRSGSRRARSRSGSAKDKKSASLSRSRLRSPRGKSRSPRDKSRSKSRSRSRSPRAATTMEKDGSRKRKLEVDTNSNKLERRECIDGVPDRWEDYCKIGTVVEGTNFIAFKVPLKKEILDKVSEGVDKWSVDDVINAVPSPGLGLVIDLTFTTRYYDPNIFTSKEIEHKKILTKGHNIPNNALVEEFNETVDKSDGNKLIGVHCTHGLNRTGYLVCRYMIQKQGFQPEVAIAAFDDARGHKQERVNYLNHLKAKGWQGGGGGGGGFGGEERRGGGFDEFNVEEQLNYKAEETEQESIKAMEEEAEKLRQMQVEVDKQLAVPLSPTGNLNLSFEEKSVYIGNVDYGATAEELEIDRNDNKRSLRDRSRSRSRHFDHKQSRESRGERDTFEEHREPTKASSRYSLEVKRPQSPGSNRFQDSGYHKRRTEKYYSNESKISSRYCERSNDYEGRVRRDDSGTRDRHDTNKFKQERKESSSDSDSSWGDA